MIIIIIKQTEINLKEKKKNDRKKKKRELNFWGEEKNLPVKLNDAVAFGFFVIMWAPPRSNVLGADCDHAPGGEYVIEES